ncbi:MAG: sigma-70 family RNA polymerase sigma factor [Planctomycetes bacterium]|nr:sigma-70 family RNA polymerase sigma factor [Planctomycetota bacterium]
MIAMTDTLTDADLIRGLVAQEEEVVAEFLDRYWARAFGIAVQLTGDPASAEDVTQDAFVAALRGVGKLSEGDPLRAWFFRIVENTAKKQHRTDRRRKARHQGRAAQTRELSEDPTGTVARSEEHSLVKAHLAELSPKLRHTLALRYLEDMSLAEVARVLDIPRQTVSSRIRLGLESLRNSLQPQLALSALALPALVKVALAGSAPSAPPAGVILSGVNAIASLAETPPQPSADEILAQARKPGWAVMFGALALLTAAVIGVSSLLSGPDAEGSGKRLAQRDPLSLAPTTSALAGTAGGTARETASGTGDPWVLDASDEGPDKAPSPPPGEEPLPTSTSKTKNASQAQVKKTDEGWVLTGVVRESETSLPVVGARIGVGYYEQLGGRGWSQGGYGDVSSLSTGVVTDASGRFRAPIPKPFRLERRVTLDTPRGEARPVHFFVQAKGRTALKEDRVVLDPSKPIELRMKPGVLVRGRVVDALTGKPVAGAHLTLSEKGRMGSLPSADSDHRGAFEFSVAPDSAYEIRVEAPGYSDFDLASPALDLGQATEDKELRLQPAALLSVRVVDEKGRDVRAHVMVTQGSEVNETGRYGPVFRKRTAQELARPLLGISFGAPGLTLKGVSQDSAASRAGLKVGDVIVKLDDQEPVDDQTLRRVMAGKKVGDSLRLVVQRKDERIALTATLGARQRKYVRVRVWPPLRFETLPPGGGYTVTLTGMSRSGALWETERVVRTDLELRAGSNPELLLVLRQEEGQQVSPLVVCVVDTEGQPVVGCEVRCQESKGSWIVDSGAPVKTDAKGQAAFQGRVGGQYRIQLGRLLVHEPIQFDPKTHGLEPFEFRLPGTRRLVGRVLDERGQPIPNARISADLDLNGGYSVGEIVADQNGMFSEGGFPERFGPKAHLYNFPGFELPWSVPLPELQGDSLTVTLRQPKVLQIRAELELVPGAVAPEVSVRGIGAGFQLSDWRRRDHKLVGSVKLSPDFAGAFVFHPKGFLPVVSPRIGLDQTALSLRIPLVRGRDLRGVVQDAQGSPVGEIRVYYAQYPGVLLAMTDPEGKFTISGAIPREGCGLELRSWQIVGAPIRISVKAGQTDVQATIPQVRRRVEDR